MRQLSWTIALIWLWQGGTMAMAEKRQTLWQIGVVDNSFGEFALAPNEAKRFAEVFGKGVEFVVGETPLSCFPFIHPSAADAAWGGKPEVPFVICFSLPHEPEGIYALHIALADTHERLASTMEVSVNRKVVWKQKMPLGNGRAFYGDLNGKPCAFTVPIQASLLRKGSNELTIVLRDGSWVAYDAIQFVRWQPSLLPSPPSPKLQDVVVTDAEAFAAERALLLPQKVGFHAVGDTGSSVTLQTLLKGDGFRTEFAFMLTQGAVALGFALPEEGADNAWLIVFDRDGDTIHIGWQFTPASLPLRPSRSFSLAYRQWLQIAIEHRYDRTFVTIRDDEKVLARMEAVHVPVPDGQLRWTAQRGETEWSVANLTISTKAPKPSVQTPTISAPKPVPRLAPRVPFVRFDRHTGELVLGNAALELHIATKDGINPHLLIDRRTGRKYADADYCYTFPEQPLPELVAPPKIKKRKNGSIEVTLVGQQIVVQRFGFSVGLSGSDFVGRGWVTERQDILRIKHHFRILPNSLEEQLMVTNVGRIPVSIANMTFGFAKLLLNDKGWMTEMDGCRFVAIPYRREPETGTFQDFSASELVWRQGWFHLANYPGVPQMHRYMTQKFGSEGWAWVDADDDHALVIAKHNNEAMEWSVLRVRSGNKNKKVLLFGGAALWKLGDPEPAAELKPKESFTFGVTRYIPCRGGWKGAFYAFRDWMNSLGHKPPKGYNPPVHWNELYDNPLWWGPDTPERRQQFYRKEHMEEEAKKAAELGCEALYLDPGWDTSFASSVWADERLGKQKEFVKMLKERYGLQMALHTPLAGWCDVNAYPMEARRRSKDGQVLPSLCSAAPAYLKTKTERLLKLCRDGAVFLMFDGSAFTGECYDEKHGHPLPLTRHEHCLAYLGLVQMVKRKFPNVLIELHDPIVAGVTVRYAPTYFLHGLPHSFDELWGYEFMWNPMDDLLSGRAISLYYVRLAYNIPIYLHIDLRKDNENALMFWWYASTCRHLGVGGKHPDPKVWDAHKKAMRTYRRLKRFYTQGEFYGLDETVHAHVLRSEKLGTRSPIAVLNIFNLSATEAEREIQFKPKDIGLPNDLRLHCIGVPYRQDGDEVNLWVRLPALGHQLVEVQIKQQGG